MMTLEKLETRRAVAERKLVQALARQQRAEARLRTRQKRASATRHYRLGLVLEGFVFDEPALLARVREWIERESPRVREAFGLDEAPSWFEQPVRDDPKKMVDTRRVRLGMVLERLLPEDEVLIARIEALIREQALHVQQAFGLGGEGESWFDVTKTACFTRRRDT
jgi:hypothetical protein